MRLEILHTYRAGRAIDESGRISSKIEMSADGRKTFFGPFFQKQFFSSFSDMCGWEHPLLQQWEGYYIRVVISLVYENLKTSAEVTSIHRPVI